MTGRAPLLAAFLAVLALASCPAEANYHSGDFVPAARRAQFHGQRTQWHDLLGRHCPKFGHTKTVAIPLPEPVGFIPGDEYKLALSADNDKLHTPWLTLLGKGAPDVPLVDVTLSFAGGVVRSMHARSVQVPAPFLVLHEDLVSEWKNATAWPKHVLVRYQWLEDARMDVAAGLLCVLLLGLVFTTIAIGRSTFSNERALTHFFTALATDAPLAIGARTAKTD